MHLNIVLSLSDDNVELSYQMILLSTESRLFHRLAIAIWIEVNV